LPEVFSFSETLLQPGATAHVRKSINVIDEYGKSFLRVIRKEFLAFAISSTRRARKPAGAAKERILGEIRSTIDLMMERTRGMSLSAEEKKTLHRQDLAKRAGGFVMRLLDNPSGSDEILAPLRDESQEDRDLLESLIWNMLTERLSADHDLPKYLDVMGKLKQAETKDPLLKELRSAFHAALKHQSETRKKSATREKKKLAAFGISGSAVVPKLPREDEFGEDFAVVLNKFKEGLLEVIPEIDETATPG
jgi:hypothetical protein